MGPRPYTEQRLEAFLSELRRLEQSEFPYRHSEDALKALEGTVEDSLNRVRGLPATSSQPIINQRCALELTQALEYLPLMGFLLRSTNVRNAFEVFRPILRISRKLLGAVGVAPNDVRVLLSSEWDLSPFVYQTIPYLSGYVLVGIPATESSNPLILPLAGHELGHTVWVEAKLEAKLRNAIGLSLVGQVAGHWNDFAIAYPTYAAVPPKNDAAIMADMFIMDVISQAYRLASSMVEETFCDAMGLRIFGESYLQAFAYLISPCWGEYRSVIYPNTQVRASNLVTMANTFGIASPANYVSWFEDRPLASSAQSDKFLMDIADSCLAGMIATVTQEVNAIVTTSGLVGTSAPEVTRIRQRLDKLMPAEQTKTLADIINAGWQAYNDPNLWPELSWEDKRKRSVLQDLLLKSIEIQDIEAIKVEVTSGP